MGSSASSEARQQEPEQGIFSLSEEMQKQLARDFHNDQIVRLFGKQMETIAERRASMLQSAVDQRNKLQQHMEEFRVRNKNFQQQLDQAIESLEDKFTDSSNVLDYEMSRLEHKYMGNSPFQSSAKLPCLLERADIATCYGQHRENPMACDSFIQALTNCAEKTITRAE
jgi:hypothetical protein